MAATDDFPARGRARAFHHEAKSPALAIEALAGEGCRPTRPVAFRRHEGREERGQPDEEPH
jgi:hypothetical protein